jgi:sigma54-dependent transcription regulator
MKILITFVGNHDPYSDGKKTLGPILSILKKRKYDKLYLLFNNDRYWNALVETQKYCNQNYPHMKVEYRETKSLNPIDYNLVYPAMFQVVSRINKDNPKADVTISITSGTPTMHSCWMFLVYGKVINAKLIQVSRENGISEVQFKLDDFPTIVKADDVKVELTKLSRENDQLKKSLNFRDALKNGFYIPDEGFDIDNKIIPAYYKGALEKSNGNATKAAELLNLKPHTFRKRLRKLNLE